MPPEPKLPDEMAPIGTTPIYSATDLPETLGSRHVLAAGVWGRLLVLSGRVEFHLLDEHERGVLLLGEGQSRVVAPGEAHRFVLDADARLRLELFREH